MGFCPNWGHFVAVIHPVASPDVGLLGKSRLKSCMFGDYFFYLRMKATSFQRIKDHALRIAVLLVNRYNEIVVLYPFRMRKGRFVR